MLGCAFANLVCVEMVQNAGRALMTRLNELGELQEVEDGLLGTVSALEWTCIVLDRCGIACQHIEMKRFHQALKILEDIQSSVICKQFALVYDLVLPLH